MRRTAAVVALFAVGIPAGALAAKPSHPATPSQTKTVTTNGTTTTVPANTKGLSAKVMFVIHGTVAAYAPVVGQANGSISVTFKSSNFESSVLKGAPQPVVFTLGPATKITRHDGNAIATGDNVVVKLRAAKNAPLSTLTSTAAFQVVDQGPSA
jgi:hypothetical protein